MENDVAEFYANSIRVNVSPFEVELQNVLMDSSGNIKGVVNIRLSPQTALSLSMALQKNMEEFQSKFGPISLPESILEKLR